MTSTGGAQVLCPRGHVSDEPDYCSVCGAAIGGRAAPESGPAGGTTSAGASALAPLGGATSEGGPGGEGVSGACPTCGTPRSDPRDRFCEVCRYDFESGVPGPPPVVSPSPAATGGIGGGTDPEAAGNPTAGDPGEGGAGGAPGAGGSGVEPPADPGAAAAPVAAGPASTPADPSAAGGAGGWRVTIEIDPSLDVEPDPASPAPIGRGERLFPVELAEMLIGRRDDKQDIRPEIPIQDPAVSRRHAKLLLLPDGGLAVLDLASANGTAVNGVETPAGERHELNDGDVLTMGRWTRITVHRRP